MVDVIGSFASWATSPELLDNLTRPGVSDFMFGNPHEIASDEYVEALIQGVRPKDEAWFQYHNNDPHTTSVIAASLDERFGIPFEAEDIYLTNGNFTGLAILLRTLVEPDEEVIFVSPPWFFYETMIVGASARAVRVTAKPPVFDLPLEAISEAINERTRAIIVNSPNNPTGKIYPPETLEALARILSEASQREGRPVYLLSDEAYNRIVFDGRQYSTPVAHYPWSFYMYTYAKTHLAPGLRFGYVAVPPEFPDREDLRTPLVVAQVAQGWSFPIAPLQHSIEALEAFTIDVAALQRRRDLLTEGLRNSGYDVVEPEGTFYIMVRSPLEDDMAYFDVLAKRDVFVLPGSVCEMPGWFRLSVTASDEMVERAIPLFDEAMDECSGGGGR
jgi:aspartate aminotransferase